MDIPGYKIGKQIGSGGMATVYLAVQEALGREVAIKVMKSTGGDTMMEDRFLREGQNLARLNHHNIAAIYNIARSDEYFYFAMELLEGGTLSEHLKQGISISFAINVILQIGSALDAAHRLGIVHRDLKPSNIIFRDAMTPVLTDFGIAKDTTSDTRLTGTGMMVGTPHYMSPEQIMGRKLDGRSDVYSLGVVFYELLTGKLPFDAEGDQVAFSVAMKHMNEAIPQLPEAVAAFQPVIDSTLAKNPDDRFPSASAMSFGVRQVAATDDEIKSRLSDETMLIGSNEFSAPMFTPSGGYMPSGGFTPSGSFTAGGGITPGGGWVSGKTPSGAQPAPGEFPSTPRSGQPSSVTLQSKLQHSLKGKGARAGLAAAAVVVVSIVVALLWPDSMDAETRAIVEGFMMQADRQVSQRQFIEPPENNAFRSLDAIFQVAPEYGPAMRLVEEITGILEAEALIAIADQRLDDASLKTDEGLRFDPANEGLLAVRDRVELARDEIKRAENVARLLAQAAAEVDQEIWLISAEEGAAVTLQQVLQLDPGNERALAQLNDVVTVVLQNFRAQLESEESEDLLVERLTLLKDVVGSDQRVAGLVQETQGELELRVNRERARQLVISAQPLLEGGKYYSEDAAQDSALPLLLEAQRLDPDNFEAAVGMDRIATHYASLSSTALENEAFSEAADYIEIGLLADSRNEPLLVLSESVQAAVAARAGQIATLLSQAKQLITSGDLIEPANPNALEVLEEILVQSPGNSEAQPLLDRLPLLVSEKVNDLVAANNFSAGKALAADAIKAFPQRQDFASVPAEIDSLEAGFQQGQQLEALLDLGGEVLRNERISSIEMQRGVRAYRGVLNIDSKNEDAQAGLGQLELKGNAAAQALLSVDDLEAASQYVDEISAAFPESIVAGQTRAAIAQRKVQLGQEAEQRRLAASRSVLLQVLPWGRIDSLKRVGGETESLPEQTVTPIRMLLLPGRYEVAFSHPGYDQAVTLSFQVSETGSNEVTAVFEEMKAVEFFAEVKF